MLDDEILNGKWVIGVSGGPDSMALLEMAVEKHVRVIVAHVNYHKRSTADRDENCVREYCHKHDLPFFVLSPHYEKGNFQSWAREVRYAFFFRLIDQENCDGVLIAHHKEDLIETYIFQKMRKMETGFWGLPKERLIDGYRVLRPLLSMTKSQLMDYCQQKGVVFYHDESNFGDDYSRNQIRHKKIDVMNEEEMDRLCREIEALNLDKELYKSKLENFLTDGKIPLEDYIHLKETERIDLLRLYLSQSAYRKKGYSLALLQQWDQQLCQGHGNLVLSFDSHRIIRDYQFIYAEERKEVSYRYVLEQKDLIETPYFKVSESGKTTEAVSVKKEDFPLVIRSCQPNDAIQLRWGTKKINRWFIDRKIPIKDREIWPIVENCQGKIILVPDLGCDIDHYTEKPSFFVIKSMIK